MKLTKTDAKWLAEWYPALGYDPSTRVLNGELDFCADYDRQTREIVIDTGVFHVAVPESTAHIDDVFEIEIHLVPQVDQGGPHDLLASIRKRDDDIRFTHAVGFWPRVIETGGRRLAIVRDQGVRRVDLHLFEDGSCCLGVQPAPSPHLRISAFMHDLVVPFFYRLAYVERFGLSAAQNNLWGEYDHGLPGIIKYENEMRTRAAQKLSPSDACSCGRNLRFRDCCQKAVDIVTAPRPAVHVCAAERERVLKELERVDRLPLWVSRV